LNSPLSSSRIEKQAPQLKFIDYWPRVVDVIRTVPNVRIALPAVQGQGFASRGGNPIGVSMTGADPAEQDEVSPVSPDLISGTYVGLASDQVVIDYELAQDLSVAVGDRIRMTSSAGNSESLMVAGIYSRGQGRGGAYVTLRTGQSMFAMGNSVNVILVKVYELFGSDEVADRIQSLVPWEARSWSREFGMFVSSLTAQAASAYLISAFSLIASSFAIASVLIVSVLQKSKQIGILKSMGATRSQILRLFTLEGLVIAITGSLGGALVGTLIVYLVSLVRQPTARPGEATDEETARAIALLERVGLGDQLVKHPDTMSGGQNQRCAIIRALANQPKIVLADEPTGNLDSRSGDEVFNIMREMNRENGVAFIMVTHDDRLAQEADRILMIDDGWVHQVGKYEHRRKLLSSLKEG